MKKKFLLLILCCSFLLPQTTKAETIIQINDGTVIVFKGIIHCKDIQGLTSEYSCKSNVEIPKGNGVLGWRKWIKKHYTKNSPYLKIKRGKIKYINNQKTLTYKKWLFGKRMSISTIE